MRQPWPFSVTWHHRTRDIRFTIGYFLLVIRWNRASIYIDFWRYLVLSIFQYPIVEKNYIFIGGPDLRKWRRAPDSCVTPLCPSCAAVYRTVPARRVQPDREVFVWNSLCSAVSSRQRAKQAHDATHRRFHDAGPVRFYRVVTGVFSDFDTGK